MIQQVNFASFLDRFNNSSYENNFSYEGKKALFTYLEELEESTGEQIEFDMIALCCEYTEYENLAELQKQYPKIKTIEELQDNTQYIPIYNLDDELLDSFIIQNY